MDWKMLISQIIIALITTTFGSYLTYKKAIKESDNKIEEVKINAKNEIEKIKEESNREISRIKAESAAIIKEKNQDIKNEAILKFLDNPEKLDNIMNVYKKAKKFKK